MRRRASQLHTLVGAYVVDALPVAERAGFERHLGGCEQCRDDVRGLREATAALAFAAAEQPRDKARDATMQAAGRVRQLPPVLPGEQRRGRPWQAAFRAGLGRLAWLAPRDWLTRTTVVATAALAVTAIVLGVHMSAMQGRMNVAEQRDHDIAAVLGAGDAIRLTADISTGGTATVVMSHRDRALVIITHGLPALPASEGYEVWLMNRSGDRSAGMLPPPRAGMTDPMVVSRLRPGDRLGLTVEPAGGSHRPTSAPIVLLSLGG
jgi:anti-sigma-K factor RskA